MLTSNTFDAESTLCGYGNVCTPLSASQWQLLTRHASVGVHVFVVAFVVRPFVRVVGASSVYTCFS